MAKSSNQKLKLIYLMKILLEKTDETRRTALPCRRLLILWMHTI